MSIKLIKQANHFEKESIPDSFFLTYHNKEKAFDSKERKKLNILAIDTTSSWGSIALSKNGKIVYSGYLDIRVTHSERLMLQIDYGLQQSEIGIDDLDLLALSNGPGSFTGVRIGLATAKGICMAKEIPLYPVNTLKLIAYNVYGCGFDVMPFVDARMNEIYAALFDKEMKEVIPPQSSDPLQFINSARGKTFIIGDGVEKYRELIEDSGKDFLIGLPHQNIPLASVLISLVISEGVEIEYNFNETAELEPFYLRKSQAEMKKSLSRT